MRSDWQIVKVIYSTSDHRPLFIATKPDASEVKFRQDSFFNKGDFVRFDPVTHTYRKVG